MKSTLYTLFTLFLLQITTSIFAQSKELFMPRNIGRSYEKGTRSHDGKPGANYWQNRSEYKIDVNIDIPKHTVNGVVKIKYFNNSPDSLKMLRIKLAHDLWKKGGQRASDMPVQDITDIGVDIQSLKIGGKTIENPNKLKANTFLTSKLEVPMTPKSSIDIEVTWSYIAPTAEGSARECVCDSTSWFLSYWYPQMAVYDDLHGWADAPYNGLQEQYNDFSDYEVKVTVPSTVGVWATGELQNAPELFQPEFLTRWENAHRSSDIIKVFSPEDYAAKKSFFKAKNTHTFVYRAYEVPDFALAISDHYLWDATSLIVDKKTNRRTFVGAVYNPTSKDYYEVCKIAQQSIDLMSNYQPGYPYPYPAMTVFNGDDGMEFPMMCNDASTYPNSPVGLTSHEISHTYFPFMMGINEQYYAWMDEGWASFFDVNLTDTIKNERKGTLRNYSASAGTDNDLPPMVPARFMSGPSYRIAAYTRPQAAYFTLLDMMGYEKFHQCMVTYMDTWKGKHPMPFDFFNTWSAAYGDNLDWFWKPWFFDFGHPDLAIQSVVQKGKKATIIIENKGTMPTAIFLDVIYEDGSKETIHKTADVWKLSGKTQVLKVKAMKKITKVTMSNRFVADTNMKDNEWILVK
jgi:Peptidase family M1 domain